jgi:alkaline phosphatase D
MKTNIERRRLLATAAKLAAVAMMPTSLGIKAADNIKFVDYPFKLGVASGDPLPDGFVIWTKLAPVPMDPLATQQVPIKVEWYVAEDREGLKVVKHGISIAYPQNAHSVHVEVSGLVPKKEYFYYFITGDDKSQIGRVHTLPLVGESTNEYLFAVASCQSFTDGHYSAYRDMVEQDPKLVIHTGDYIYEQDWIGGTRSIPVSEARSLNDYRLLYSRYKSDLSLQAAHANCAWLLIWDDHEVDNDWAGDYNQENMEFDAFVKRKSAAFKAYFEHMPLRLAATPKNNSLRLYQRTIIGDLLQFDLIDCRQYRNAPACMREPTLHRGYKAICDEAKSKEHSFLGKEQESWLLRGIGSFNVKWNAIVQTTLMAPFDFLHGNSQAYDMDGWDNYPNSRQKILDRISLKGISNPIAFGGNIHANYAGVVNSVALDNDSEPLMSEFVCTSITSGGGGEDRYRSTLNQFSENPFARYFDNRKRGFLLCHANKKRLKVTLRTVNNINDPYSSSSTLDTLVVEDGVVDVKKI